MPFLIETDAQSSEFVPSWAHWIEHWPGTAVALLWGFAEATLFFIVPDEDLYEQGVFPSRFNRDHKATFTLSKRHSWSSHSYNMLDLANRLPGAKVLRCELQDEGYDRRHLTFDIRRVARQARPLWRQACRTRVVSSS